MQQPTLSQFEKSNETQRARVGLVAKVIIPALILSIVASLALFEWFERKAASQGLEDLRSRLQVFTSTQAAELAEPIWVFDQMTVDRLFRSYSLNNDLLQAKLYDAKGHLLAEAKGPPATGSYRTIAADQEITRRSAEEFYRIGRLEVVYHDGNIRKTLASRRLADLLALAVLILFLVGATALAFHWQIGLPLRRLRESLNRNRRLGLRDPLQWSSRDELGEVVNSYNSLLAEIDGQTRHLESVNAALENENRQRKEAEESLKEKEEQLELVLEASRDGFWDWDIETGKLYLSPRWLEQLGYQLGDLEANIGTLKKVCHPDDFDRVMKAINEHLTGMVETSYLAEHRFLAKSGEWKWILARGKIIPDGEGKPVRMIGTATDITERKKTEEERARLAKALEQTHESVIMTDVKGFIVFVNPAFEKTYGYSVAEVIGLSLDELKCRQNEAASYKRIWDSLLEDAVWTGHILQLKKDGTPMELAATIFPVRDSSGEIINYVEIARDVSHEIELQKQLQQAQKMEAVGTLAGGIAHDFNNILAAIIGYTDMLLLNASLTESMLQDLNQVLKAAHRAKNVVRQILVISRSDLGGERLPVSLSRLIEEDLKFLRATLPSTIEIRQDLKNEADTVLADPTQIDQIIMNLCTNAAHAMEETGGVLQVSLTEVNIDAESTAYNHVPATGNYLQLTVSDTGHGMDAATLERVFDPYFTTKEVGKGSGLGLAVVKGMIERHRGAISVSSQPGRGSTFRVYLPRIKAAPVQPNEELAILPKGSERILYVDDEELLTDVGQSMLEELGYEVVAKTRSIEALESFRKRPEHFDLVITDYTMPGLTGLDLAKEILRIRPDIPVILCSGFSEKITGDKVKEIGVRAFLMKPFDLNAIALQVRKVIDDGAGRPAFNEAKKL